MKQFITSKLLVVCALAFFIGCGDNKKHEIKTVEYYEQHIEEAKAREEQCKKEGQLSEEQKMDCANASRALFFAPNQDVPYGKKNWEPIEPFK